MLNSMQMKPLIILIMISKCLAYSKFDLPRKIDLFNELISSSTALPVQDPKCQCLPPPPKSNVPTCIPYDSRLQAASLEEAIVAFPDLTITHQERTLAGAMESSANNCKTKQCRDCYKDLRAQLRKVGLLPATINEVFNNQRNFTTCDKYRFSRNDKGVYEKKKKATKHHYEWDYDYGLTSSEEEYIMKDFLTDGKKGGVKKIEKRDAVPPSSQQPNTTAMNTTGLIGVRFPISCTTRGITPDGLNTVSLCSTCWVWRRLPSTYYPAYLNEIICDYADTSCLSGYASCQTGTQQMNVLRNESGTMVPVSVSAGINCECRLQVGSVLESLALGKGTTNALPPVARPAGPGPGLSTSSPTGK